MPFEPFIGTLIKQCTRERLHFMVLVGGRPIVYEIYTCCWILL